MESLPEIGQHLTRVTEKPNLAQIKISIRKLNLKVTKPRIIMLQELYHLVEHVTAQTLYERIKPQFPQIGFATVYRFLKDLTHAGFVTEVRIGSLPAKYEITSAKEHHDHLTCTSCGHVLEFENAEIEEIQKRVARQFGFLLTSHSLELTGICPSCQRNDA